MTKAVSGGLLEYVSASAIQTFVDCRRKYFAQYVLGIKAPPKPSQEEGTRLHEQMEKYALFGDKPQHPSCRLAMEYIQTKAQRPLIQTESALEDPKLLLADVRVKGFIDYYDPTDEIRPFIRDYKSCNGFRYIKTEDELARNIQALVYMGWAMLRHPKAKSCQFEHLYLSTAKDSKTSRPKPGVRQTRIELSREEIEKALRSIEEIVDEMKAVVGATELDHVQPTWSHCGEYGGCHMADRCLQSASLSSAFEQLFAKDSTSTQDVQEQCMGIADRIKQRRQAQAVEQTADAASTTVPGPAPEPVLATGINPPDAAKPEVVEPWTPPATTPVTTTQSSTPPPVQGSATSGTRKSGLVLFVDAMPIKGWGQVQYLEDEIARRAQPIAERRRVSDIREVKYAEAVNELLASFSKEPPTGVWSAVSGGLSTSVVEVLAPMAEVLVRGRS
jgi:hypothetical protein